MQKTPFSDYLTASDTNRLKKVKKYYDFFDNVQTFVLLQHSFINKNLNIEWILNILNT